MPTISFPEKCPFCKCDAGHRYTLNQTGEHRAYCMRCGYDWHSRSEQPTKSVLSASPGDPDQTRKDNY